MMTQQGAAAILLKMGKTSAAKEFDSYTVLTRAEQESSSYVYAGYT
jgi:hypothetical protein